MRKWKGPNGEIRESEVSPGPGWSLVSAGSSDDKPRTQYVTLPDGRRALINSDTGDVIKDYGAGPEPEPDRITQGGVVYERKSNGGWSPAVGIPAPTPAPRQSDPDLYANQTFTAGENEKNRKAAQDANAASLLQQQAELQQRIAEAQAAVAQAQQQIAIQQGTLDFTVSKGEFEMSLGLTKEARETQGQVFSQQTQIATLQFSMAQAQAQQSQLQAQLESSTNQFNSTMGFNVDQANQQAEERRQQRLQGLATDIGTLAADPGDRGKYAATVLANSGWGQQDAALATTDLRTEQSLTPLQALLTQREGVMGESSTPFSYNPITAPTVAPLNFSGITMPTAATTGSFAPPPALPPTTPTAAPVTAAPAAATPFGGLGNLTAETAPAWQAWADQYNAQNTPKMADGGMAQGAYISGDSNNGKPNEEINIPLGPGVAYVIPKNKVSPTQWKSLQKMAGGGVFSQGSVFGGSTPDTTQASNFLTEASTRARSGTPFAQGQLPSPVFASSPGFDPVVAQLLASLSAQSTGLDQGSFLRLAALQAPTGMQSGVVRRSG